MFENIKKRKSYPERSVENIDETALKWLSSLRKKRRTEFEKKVYENGGISLSWMITVMEFMEPSYVDYLKIFSLSKRVRLLRKDPKIINLLERTNIGTFSSFYTLDFMNSKSVQLFNITVAFSPVNSAHFDKIVNNFKKTTIIFNTNIERKYYVNLFENMSKWKKNTTNVIFKNLSSFKSFLATHSDFSYGKSGLGLVKLWPLGKYVQKISFSLSNLANFVLFSSRSDFWTNNSTMRTIQVPEIELNIKFTSSGDYSGDNISEITLENLFSKRVVVKSELEFSNNLQSQIIIPRHVRVNPVVEEVVLDGPLIFHRDELNNRSVGIKTNYSNVKFVDQNIEHKLINMLFWGESWGDVFLNPSIFICSLSEKDQSIVNILKMLKSGGTLVLDSFSILENLLMDDQNISFKPSEIYMIGNLKFDLLLKHLTNQNVKKKSPAFSNVKIFHVCKCSISVAVSFLSLLGHFIWEDFVYVEFDDILDEYICSDSQDLLEVYKMFSNPKVKVSFSKKNSKLSFRLQNMLKSDQITKRITRNYTNLKEMQLIPRSTTNKIYSEK